MLWQKLQVNPHDSLSRSKYRECIFEWRKLIRQDEMRAEQQIVDSCDLGAFYRHVNIIKQKFTIISYNCSIARSVSNTANRSGNGAIVADDGKLLLDDADKANAFNHYFSSIGVVDNNVAPHCESLSIPECLDSIEISDDDVMSAIDKLNNKLSSGPDGLLPFLFKQLKFTLNKPLAFVFNQLLAVGVVPDDWKKATIIPVHKKGATGIMSNYRPISLTSVLSKIMERIIVNKIYKFLTAHSVLHRAQHGFVRGRSVC